MAGHGAHFRDILLEKTRQAALVLDESGGDGLKGLSLVGACLCKGVNFVSVDSGVRHEISSKEGARTRSDGLWPLKRKQEHACTLRSAGYALWEQQYLEAKLSRLILVAVLPFLMLTGCPEPESPGQPGAGQPGAGAPGAPGAPGGAPAMNAPGGGAPADGAPPLPPGTAPGAQDAAGNPGELAPDGSPPPEGEEPPEGNVAPDSPLPGAEGGVEPGIEPLPDDNPMGMAPGETENPTGLAPGETEQPQGQAPGEGAIPCGDGTCDDAEKQNPNLCPRDCSDSPPPSGDWCGDGVCDALEESDGSCAKDCK